MGVAYAEVIGDPIAHSKSPIIHKFWLEKLGLDYDYRRTLVAPGDLHEFLQARRTDPDWCGCNITLPHKQNVMAELDRVSADAGAIGAVNCVTRQGATAPRLVGSNTDWRGFMEPLSPWLDLGRTYQFAQVIGTGGAAAAVCYALARYGFTIINIARDMDKALALRQRLELFDDDLVVDLESMRHPSSIADWGEDRLDVLVNATPLGMRGFPPLPLSLEGGPPNRIVYDLVYEPFETQLLKDARARGLEAIDGLAMLVGQAAEAFTQFFNETAPREYDAELREVLMQ